MKNPGLFDIKTYSKPLSNVQDDGIFRHIYGHSARFNLGQAY